MGLLLAGEGPAGEGVGQLRPCRGAAGVLGIVQQAGVQAGAEGGLVHVDARYNSEVNIPSGLPDANGRNALYNQGYALVSAAVGVQSSDRKYSLEFWVENLTNQFYYISGFGVPEQNGNYAGYPGTPRYYGVRARVGF